MSLLACTTTYQATLGAPPEELAAVESEITHCLASAGFRNVSAEELNSQFIAEDPELVSVWSTPHGSLFTTPPFCVAWVHRRDEDWLVHFQPSNGGGDHAKFFVSTFSQCTELHSPTVSVGITSGRFLDLR